MDKLEWNEFRHGIRNDLLSMLHTHLPAGTRPDAWTPRQVFHHVLKVDRSIVGLLEKFVAKAEGALPREAGKPWLVKKSVLEISGEKAMAIPPSEKAVPDPVVTGVDLDFLSATTTMSLDELADLGDRLDLGHFTFPHPLTGPMNFYEWLVFACVHESLHVQRLKGDLFPGGA